MTVRIGLVAESARDAEQLRILGDRVLESSPPDWFEPGQLDHHRAWTGPNGSGFFDVHQADVIASAVGVRKRFYGHFQGEPWASDALVARKVFDVFDQEPVLPEVIVYGRDIDKDIGRREGLRQAVQSHPWRFSVVEALAEPEIEAWLVAAHDPAEADALKPVQARLGFNPTVAPERLTSRRADDKKDAKRVCDELYGDRDVAIERWSEAPVELLHARGAGCGLSRCIDDLHQHLLPAVFGSRRT